MPLKAKGIVEIPDCAGSQFDHGAFDPKTRRVFVAHTARDCVDVLNHDSGRHLATLQGFTEAAGVVAHDGRVLVTNRGAASLAWLDARTLRTQDVTETGARPNGVAYVPHLDLAVVACIGNDSRGPELQVFELEAGKRSSIDLPGQPRWCVPNADGTQIFLAIRDPSMILTARLPGLTDVRHWALPCAGAHGLDIDHARLRLYVACDAGALVELDAIAGKVLDQWPLDGVPDATFFNPTSGLVHVAIADPGLVQSYAPRTGAGTVRHFTKAS